MKEERTSALFGVFGYWKIAKSSYSHHKFSVCPCFVHTCVVPLHLDSHTIFINAGAWQCVALLVFFLHPHYQTFLPKQLHSPNSGHTVQCAGDNSSSRFTGLDVKVLRSSLMVSGFLRWGVIRGFPGEIIWYGREQLRFYKVFIGMTILSSSSCQV